MFCYKCQSNNVMERKGIANDYHDYICLNCGDTWKPSRIEVCELKLIPMKELIND